MIDFRQGEGVALSGFELRFGLYGSCNNAAPDIFVQAQRELGLDAGHNNGKGENFRAGKESV